MSAASPAIADAVLGKILIASPRAEFRRHIRKSIPPAEIAAEEAAGGADALLKLSEKEFGTLLLDPRLDDLDVDELVATIRVRHPAVNVVMLDRDSPTEQLNLELAAETAESKPTAMSKALEEEFPARDFEQRAAEYLPEQPHSAAVGNSAETGPLPEMIGTSRTMQQICRLARLVAPRNTAVLIVGATGTGKELVARGIHALSRRSRGPFVVVNCAAIPESLLEAELFGFTRGAFTGAFQSRLGRIHAAHGGTLLLDEVGELPLSMQAKLLRFVQEGEVQRLGSADLFRVDARLIAATNADLLQRVCEKQFREDLYYRLSIFPLNLPPLRSRLEDVLPLAEHFLEKLCQQSGLPRKVLSLEASRLLRAHTWPGNVRELQHSIERAFVLAEGREQIRAEDFSMPRTPA
ncbi:MAG TPA: sigma-54 dependent transcriptional regulator [Candidatus Dormibacteraeota bacterium]|nr:sigma-54 dependent transcriptional regulator [Candidatus Dormibacteraeota bacterium]